MRRIHDQLFKGLAVAFPADLVTLLLPEIAGEIDLVAIHFESKEYFLDTPRGRLRFPDLVAKCRGRADPDDESVIHVEHFSKYLAKTVPRLWDYNRLLGMRSGLTVHTVAVYARGGPRGLEKKKYKDTSYGRVAGVLHYNSLGLSGAPGADYLARPEPLAWALASLMRPEGFSNRAELAIACLRRIAASKTLDEARRFLLANLVQTYVELDDSMVAEYESLLRGPENQEVREMAMTWAEKHEAKGLQKGRLEGRREGRQEGRQEGRLEGMQELVIQLLAERFGSPVEELRRRIAAVTSTQELKRLAEVESAEELGLA